MQFSQTEVDKLANQIKESLMKKVCGPETQKALSRRKSEGFLKKYCGGKGIDIGYRGEIPDAVPLPGAIGVELDYPGYDGKRLPFEDGSLDFVYSSHCLEHISDWRSAIVEYFRVLKVGGFLVLAVPHQFLYEKRRSLPSMYNGDHKRFYTPASLLAEVESSLAPNSYRLRHLKDCDVGYDYSIPPARHSAGEYEIECVLQKIELPAWNLDYFV